MIFIINVKHYLGEMLGSRAQLFIFMSFITITIIANFFVIFIFNVKNHLGEMLGSLLGLFRMLVGGGGTMILPPELCCWKKKGELFM